MGKFNCLILDDNKLLEMIFPQDEWCTTSVSYTGYNYNTTEKIDIPHKEINFTLLRTFEEAQDYVKTRGFPDMLVLDEDLGWGADFGGANAPDKCGSKFMLWLIHYDRSLESNVDHKGNRFHDIKYFRSCSNHSFSILKNTYDYFYLYMSDVTKNICDGSGVRKKTDDMYNLTYPAHKNDESNQTVSGPNPFDRVVNRTCGPRPKKRKPKFKH